MEKVHILFSNYILIVNVVLKLSIVSIFSLMTKTPFIKKIKTKKRRSNQQEKKHTHTG
jgi:hypothetical protein